VRGWVFGRTALMAVVWKVETKAGFYQCSLIIGPAAKIALYFRRQ
jgi:hypothetical protein